MANDHREQIIRALERMIGREHGYEFQPIAIQVAKQYYPTLVASEWKRDGGQDAISLPTRDPTGRRVSLACSVTPTLAKVRSDCDRITNRGVALDELVFATPAKVTNLTIAEWQNAIAEETGITLTVLPREEIICFLEKPENHWICEQYLALALSPSPVRPSSVRAVAQRIVDSWSDEYAPDNRRLVDIGVRQCEPTTHKQLGEATINMLALRVRGGSRLAIVGRAGAGKTVLLIRLARLLLKTENAPLPILLSLPELALRATDLDSYLFDTTRIDLAQLHELDSVGGLAIFLNGWNEVPATAAASVSEYLRGFARRFTNCSLVTTSRVEIPPLTHQQIFEIQPLTHEQRRKVVIASGLRDSESVSGTLLANSVLDDVTRTPLFLMSALDVLAAGEPLPETRFGILEAFVELTEKGEHGPTLSADTHGHHRTFMRAMAASLVRDGTTSCSNERAVSLVAAVSRGLVETTVLPEPVDAVHTLDVLADHYLLRRGHGSDQSVGFLHPWFQDWFASLHCLREFEEARSTDSLEEFQAELLGQPAWQAAVELSVESFLSRADYRSAAELVRSVLPLDLALAAALAGLGDPLWLEVGPDVREEILRLQRLGSDGAQELANACMLATRSPDFSSHFLGLVESEDDQVRLGTYRSYRPFSPRCLGGDWLSIVQGWDPNRRAEFYNEVLSGAGPTEARQILEALESEEDVPARSSGLRSMCFYGLGEFASQLIHVQDASFWAHATAASLIKYLRPERNRQLANTFESLLDRGEASDDRLRLEMIEFLVAAQREGAVERLKAHIRSTTSPGEDHPALTLLADFDLDWVRTRYEEGALAGRFPNKYHGVDLASFSDLTVQAIVRRLDGTACTPEAMRADLQFLAAARPDLAAELRVRSALAESPRARVGAKRAPSLADAYFWPDLPLTVLLEATLRAEEQISTATHVDELLRLIAPHGAIAPTKVGMHYGESLPAGRTSEIRDLVLRLRALVPDTHEWTISHLVNFLGAVGADGDAEEIDNWISSENQRAEQVRATTGRPSDLDTSMWYCGALARLPGKQGTGPLHRRLRDPRYFRAACETLAWLNTRGASQDGLWFRRGPYHRIPDSPLIQSSDTQYTCDAVFTAFGGHHQTVTADPSPPYRFGLFAAAKCLASLSDARALECIELIGVEEYDEWSVLAVFEALALNGLNIPYEVVARVLEGLRERIRQRPWDAQMAGPLPGLAAISLFSDNPAGGVKLCAEVLRELRSLESSRQVVEALAYCGHLDARDLLLTLYDGLQEKPIAEDIARALGKYPGTEVAAILLGCSGRTARTTIGTVQSMVAASDEVKNWALGELRSTRNPVEAERLTQAGVQLDRDELGLAACEFIAKHPDASLPGEVRDAVVSVFSKDRSAPLGWSAPRASNAVRLRLYELMTAGSSSARDLLIYLEVARAKSGRPGDESRHPNVTSRGKAKFWLCNGEAEEATRRSHGA